MSNLDRALDCVRKLIAIYKDPPLTVGLPSRAEALEGAVPQDVLTTYRYQKLIEEVDTHGVFWGHTPLDIGSLKEGLHPNFSLLELLPDFISYDTNIFNAPFLVIDKFGELEDARILDNDRSMFAWAKDKDDSSYIYRNCEADEAVNGIIGEVDSIGNYLAPSILDHLLDLETGLLENKYIIREYEITNAQQIVFPQCWCDRVRVQAGEVEMDQFGSIVGE